MIKATAHGATDVGRKRDHNEDSFSIDEEVGVYIVCDGLGGHAAGEVASEIACSTIQRVLSQNRKVLSSYAEDPTLYNRARATAIIEVAIDTASREVFIAAQEDPTKKGMATTLVMLVVMGANAIAAHVGDSRLYLFRRDKTYQLTEDHTMLNEQVRRGQISQEEAAKTKKTGIVTRTVGYFEAAEADTLHLELMPGDTYLLCSDGMCDYFAGGEFGEACRTAEHHEGSLPWLIQLANERGGKDNITGITVKIEGELAPEATEADRKLDALKKIPVFSNLSYQELMKVLNVARLEAFSAGDQILTEGDDGDTMYVSVTGTFEVTKNGQHVADLPTGSFFGDMALIDKAPRSASIITKENAKLLAIERKSFFHLIKTEHALAAKLLWAFCQIINHRLRETTEELSSARSNLSGESPALQEIRNIFEEEDDPDLP
ncbi:MAG: cyclic nucleotide-binding domain-containing protein [Phycisphaeraceae bacterium]|nr:cyclic nucleotide-binding domain-containing protein [Phycisphaeraceae bacterium]